MITLEDVRFMYEYLCTRRAQGHTTTMMTGFANAVLDAPNRAINPPVLVVHEKSWGKQLLRQWGINSPQVKVLSLAEGTQKLRGLDAPLAFDNMAIQSMLGTVLAKHDDALLRETSLRQRNRLLQGDLDSANRHLARVLSELHKERRDNGHS